MRRTRLRRIVCISVCQQPSSLRPHDATRLAAQEKSRSCRRDLFKIADAPSRDVVNDDRCLAPALREIAVKRTLFVEFVPLRAGTQRRPTRRQEEPCVNQMIYNLRVLLLVQQQFALR